LFEKYEIKETDVIFIGHYSGHSAKTITIELLLNFIS